MNKKVNKIKFILKGSFIIIIMCFFTFACSSESDTNNETENSELAIIDISPNSGHIGDEVTINWSGLNETITSSNVKFNNLNADIVSINPNQLTCIVPENAISGIIELSLNQNQVFSDEDFIILENTESFNISSHSPEIPKPGYKMQLFGEGFGIEANNVQIIFKDFNGGDIDANILNINNDLIELAIPVNASNSNIEININDEVIIYEITLSDINHEPIYYFFANKFYSFLLDNNGEVNSTQESTSFSGIDQITSIAYDNMDDTFYGLSNYTSGASPKTRFVSFDDSNNSKFSTILCYCNNDHSSLTNTTIGKKIIVTYNQDFGNYYVTFKEIDSNGNVLNESDPINTQNYAGRFVYIPNINSYVYVEDQYTSFTIYKINASNFELSIEEIGSDVVENHNIGYSFAGLVYDQFSQKIFYPRGDDIYEIDLNNNTVEKMDTDWYNFFETNYNENDFYEWSRPVISIYYPPTNEILIHNYSNFDSYSRHKIFAVNLASKQTRELTNGLNFIYSGNSNPNIYEWVMKYQ